MLQHELGVEPSEATQRIYNHILNREIHSGEPSTSKHPAPQPSTTLSSSATLVGRSSEWPLLQAAWQRAAAGHAQFVAICGEAGIGKSRLASELLVWASHQGILTAQTRSHEAQGALAYAPVAELLRSDALRKRLERLEDLWLVEVARLLPNLLSQRPGLPAPQPMTESWQRLRFFEALAMALLLDDQPLLLCFDDLQWCDQETLAWLHYLVSHHHQARLLVIGTVRDDEIDETHAFGTLQAALGRLSQLTKLHLKPLSAAETTALATQLIKGDLSDTQTSELYRDTAGNPLFVLETVRAGTWQQGETTQQETPTGLPPKVYAVLRYRLTQLSPQAQSVAHLAAVIGRSFSYAVLCQALQQDEDTLVDSLDELWRRRIVVERADAYDFSHDRLRDVAYAEISNTRRRLLHRRVAESLALIHADDLSLVYGQLAAHYAGGGLIDDAITFYQRAGDQARQIYARHEALNYYQQALALAEGHDVEVAILACRAQVLLDMYQGQAAAQDYQRLIEYARAQKDRQQELEALLGLGWAYYIIAMDQPDSDAVAQSWDCYAAAYGVASALDDRPGMVQARVGTRYHVMFSSVYASQSQANIDEALTLSRLIGDEDLVLDSVMAAMHFRKPSEWEPLGEGQVARLQTLGERTKWTELNFLLLVNYALRGNFAGAVACADLCIQLAAESGVPPVSYPSYKAIALLQWGRYDTAWHSLQQEVADKNHPFSRTFQTFVRALYLLDLLAYRQAATLLAEVVAQAIQLHRPWLRDLATVHWSRALALSGEYDCQDLCARDEVLSGMTVTLLARIIGQPSVARGEIALALGEPAATLAQLEVGIIAAGEEGRRPDSLMGQEVKARSLLQLARFEEAMAVADEALTLAESLGTQPMVWRLQESRAVALKRLGRAVEADQALQAAATIIQRLAASLPEEALRQGFLADRRVLAILGGHEMPSTARQ